MIPRIYHFTAATKALSWEERRIEQRTRRMLPDWEGHLWDDADNSRLMQQHFPQFATQYEAIRFGVMKADIARCAYMHIFGGFYFDTDYKLLKPIVADLLQAHCVLPIEEGTVDNADFKIGNSVLGSAPAHPFWGDFIAHVFVQHKPETLTDYTRIPAISGPRGITRFYNAHRDRYPDITFPARDLFHPDRSWLGLRHRGGAQTYGIHLCWASWRGKSPLRAITNFLRRKLTAF